MIGAAIWALVYGAAMTVGGVFAHRRVGSVPSLVGGTVLGGLAEIGGVMMLVGLPAGRGIALLGSVLAALFFGWSLSRAILNQRSKGRAGGLFALSVATVAVLVWAG